MSAARRTIQRIKIMDYLKNTKAHPTAEKIHKKIKKQIPTISLATVYRNLNVLRDAGKIVKIEYENESHYDANLKFHQHFICRKCKKISDIHNENITKYAIKNIDYEKFMPEKVKIIYYGICKKCKGGV
ncbi:transcriptional repressor [Candidatus Woesearchaeota archaeon]|nr:transcriptional repressor [Candidatus Woesearchaeota archaeon]